MRILQKHTVDAEIVRLFYMERILSVIPDFLYAEKSDILAAFYIISFAQSCCAGVAMRMKIPMADECKIPAILELVDAGR